MEKPKLKGEKLDSQLSKLYEKLGEEEFNKLDSEFINAVAEAHKINYLIDILKSTPELHTAEEIMPVFYDGIRRVILEEVVTGVDQRKLGKKFREINEDLFLPDDTPDSVKEKYYGKCLIINDFSNNIKYFEGKKVSHAIFSGFSPIPRLYGDDLYKVYSKYKALFDIIDKKAVYYRIELPEDPETLTKEQKHEKMCEYVRQYINYEGLKDIQTWKELKMVLDFFYIGDLPFANLNINPKQVGILKEYGVEKLEEIGLDIKYLLSNSKITNLDEINNLEKNGMSIKDIKKFMDFYNAHILDRYTIKQLLEYGIKDLEELTVPIRDLNDIKEALKKRPRQLINLGSATDEKIKFIKKYGIDNIIALDNETEGIFSHPIWNEEIYLTMFAYLKNDCYDIDSNKQFSYEEFKDEVYKILYNFGKRKITNDFPEYDFIKGKFREEHPEIFLDVQNSKIKTKFYRQRMTAEDVRKNPELEDLLLDKEPGRIFQKEIKIQKAADNKQKVNMAEYFCQKIGEKEFLKLCADYGACLDYIELVIDDNLNIGEIRDKIESEIYIAIKEKGLEYFADMPLSFQNKHPELFLPTNMNKNLREEFCRGEIKFEHVRLYPELKEILLSKDIDVCCLKSKYKAWGLGSGCWKGPDPTIHPMWQRLSKEEILNFAQKYGKYLESIAKEDFIEDGDDIEIIEDKIESRIEKGILTRELPYNENVPEFFKKKYSKLFLDKDAPEDLREIFYDRTSRINWPGLDLNFEKIEEHPEWKKFLKGKNLSRAFPNDYIELFARFDSETLMKLSSKNPEIIDKMAENQKAETLEKWYKATGGKFVPHHVVMLHFPDEEIDDFLKNGKKWSQLMRIQNYSTNEDGKAAILKAAYAFGVFKGSDDGFNKTIKLFTDVPQEISEDDYEKAVHFIKDLIYEDGMAIPEEKKSEMKELLSRAYVFNNDGKYILSIDKQKEKEDVKLLRKILEYAEIPGILTPRKAHQIFDSFSMVYNPKFTEFFYENIDEILSNDEYSRDISLIQRQFKDIETINAGRRLTLATAQAYIKNIAYTNIEVGNEKLAEQAKIVGYSQEDFERLQSLFNEGEVREFSSIPRIEGETEGYTYEILRLDDPLALTIGELTDCCQEINGAGRTSMEHSVISPDGRVFCVRDLERRIVAQSWIWRNQDTICFDNIEIPNRIFSMYEKKHPEIGRKGLTKEVLDVYKKAASDLIKEDEEKYHELLENEVITPEQYEALLLGKITIGSGYNDIADALSSDNTTYIDTDKKEVIKTDQIKETLYTDANIQYVITERKKETKRSEENNLYVYEDDLPIYDKNNISNTILFSMKRMEQTKNGYHLKYLNNASQNDTSEKIIEDIAFEYGLNPDNTKVIATSRTSIIYSNEKEKIQIADIFTSPLKSGLTEEQKQKAELHIKYQIKKALNQIGILNSEVDLSSLDEEAANMIQSIIEEIENENERGEE